VPSRARLLECGQAGGGVGDELAVDGVGQPAPQRAHRFHGGLGLLELAPAAGAPGGVVAELDDAGHVEHVVDRRFPARESRWRVCCPLEASMGAVPFQEAKWPGIADDRASWPNGALHFIDDRPDALRSLSRHCP